MNHAWRKGYRNFGPEKIHSYWECTRCQTQVGVYSDGVELNEVGKPQPPSHVVNPDCNFVMVKKVMDA